MSARCEKYEGSLGHLAAGELRGLERRRVESHVLGCGPCQSAVEDLRLGMSAARTWEPPVTAAHLAALNQRLEPMLGRGARRAAAPGRRWLLAGAALAAVLAIGVLGIKSQMGATRPASEVARAQAGGTQVDTPSVEGAWAPGAHGVAGVSDAPGVKIVRAAPGASPGFAAPRASSVGASNAEASGVEASGVKALHVERRQLGPHLRMLASSDWQGRVEGEPGDHAINLTSGFVVLDFIGGEGRRLRVSTPDALVEVVGTRFFVEVDREVTRVGVSQGQVRVLTLLGLEVLRAGDRLTVGGDGAGPGSAEAFLNDGFLLEHRAAPSSGNRRPPRRQQLSVERAGGVEAPTSPHILERLAHAEQVAGLGEYREAIGLYRDIARDAPQETLRDLARYEMARLWGFRMGEIQRARSLLGPLAKGSDEVSRQARLALCELDLKARPCAAAACLHRIEQGAEDFQLREEASRLLAHWDLEDHACAP